MRNAQPHSNLNIFYFSYNMRNLGGGNFTVNVLKALKNAKAEFFQGLNPKSPSLHFM